MYSACASEALIHLRRAGGPIERRTELDRQRPAEVLDIAALKRERLLSGFGVASIGLGNHACDEGAK